MIISGGVNIYPQEVEDVLVAASQGRRRRRCSACPTTRWASRSRRSCSPATGVMPRPDLERELLAYSREHLAHYKCPRSVDFTDELPRLPTGKLYKRLLRDRYWGKTGSRIV